jgi:IS605 OrfB family transposase
MIYTIRFRLFPTPSQKKRLHEIFNIYNRAKRKGYRLLIKNEANIQQQLMAYCQNNPYVNSILLENQQKFHQQITWLEKHRSYLQAKGEVIHDKITAIKHVQKGDWRLRGLYARLSAIQNRLRTLQFKPLIFGGKRGFRDRIRHKLTHQEFQIHRDASFTCVGKKKGVNLNIKVLTTKEVQIRTFSKAKGKKWLIIPFSVNEKQESLLQILFQAEKYTATVKRLLVRRDLRYYVHFSYELPEPEKRYAFENGAIGLDMNYQVLGLTNVDQTGRLLSYQTVRLRNLYSLRRNQGANYLSFKLDKILNYCVHKGKGLVLEDLSFSQYFSYNKSLNRKLNQFKTSALELLKRKCLKRGVAYREVFPGYTSLIGKYKYSRLHNLSGHILASYVIARRGLGLQEDLPPIYQWLLAQVGGALKPRLNPSSPYYKWAQIHDLFKHSGITSFKTSKILPKVVLMQHVLNSATGAQPNNLRAGLSPAGKIEDYHKFWNFCRKFPIFISN